MYRASARRASTASMSRASDSESRERPSARKAASREARNSFLIDVFFLNFASFVVCFADQNGAEVMNV